MASYHLSAQVIGRSGGRSAIAAAAYRSASRLIDRQTGQIHDYTRKRGVVHREIILPAGTTARLSDREQLWNEVQAAERRKDAQYAREMNIALPHEVSAEERLALVRAYVAEQFVAKGMIADVAIHAPVPERGDDPRNHHAHIMLTLRQGTADGLARTKTRAWNVRDELKTWRESWSRHQNRVLDLARAPERVDHRSLAERRHEAVQAGDHVRARILDRVPEIHIGPAARDMHATKRRPHALRPMPLPDPPARALHPISLPPTTTLSEPQRVLATQTAALSVAPPPPSTPAALPPVLRSPQPPELSRPQTTRPAPDLALDQRRDVPRSKRPQRSWPPPVTRRFDKLRPPRRTADTRPFMRTTWRLEILRTSPPRSRRKPTPLFQITLNETRPRQEWLAHVRARERITRLEANLRRIQKNRWRVTQWLRAGKLARAQAMLKWRRIHKLVRWLKNNGADPAEIKRFMRILLANRRLQRELARAITDAQREEARLHRRCYEVRLRVTREYTQSLTRRRRRRADPP